MWGCNGDARVPVELFGERTTTCPRRPVLDQPEEFAYYMRLYRMYRNGFLPESGAVMDQSGYVLGVFDVLDSVYASIEEYKSKEARRKSPSDGGSGRGSERLTSRGG